MLECLVEHSGGLARKIRLCSLLTLEPRLVLGLGLGLGLGSGLGLGLGLGLRLGLRLRVRVRVIFGLESYGEG